MLLIAVYLIAIDQTVFPYLSNGNEPFPLQFETSLTHNTLKPRPRPIQQERAQVLILDCGLPRDKPTLLTG